MLAQGLEEGIWAGGDLWSLNGATLHSTLDPDCIIRYFWPLIPIQGGPHFEARWATCSDPLWPGHSDPIWPPLKGDRSGAGKSFLRPLRRSEWQPADHPRARSKRYFSLRDNGLNRLLKKTRTGVRGKKYRVKDWLAWNLLARPSRRLKRDDLLC